MCLRAASYSLKRFCPLPVGFEVPEQAKYRQDQANGCVAVDICSVSNSALVEKRLLLRTSMKKR